MCGSRGVVHPPNSAVRSITGGAGVLIGVGRGVDVGGTAIGTVIVGVSVSTVGTAGASVGFTVGSEASMVAVGVGSEGREVSMGAESAEHAVSTANVSAKSSWSARRFGFQGAVT